MQVGFEERSPYGVSYSIRNTFWVEEMTNYGLGDMGENYQMVNNGITATFIESKKNVDIETEFIKHD